MAKKSRRARRKRGDRTTQRRIAPSTAQAVVSGQAETRETISASEFAREYAYVYSDLKRIAILAGAFMSILILLSFLID